MESGKTPDMPADETYEEIVRRLDWRWLKITVYVLFAFFVGTAIVRVVIPYLF